MTSLQWTRKIVKGNNRGTGWITLPVKYRHQVTLKNWYEIVIISTDQKKFKLTIKLTTNKASWGFYIPQELCAKHHLIGHHVQMFLQTTTYFPGKITPDRRLRLPNEIVKSYNLQQNDLYDVELNLNTQLIREIVIIKTVDRTNRNRQNEYYFIIRLNSISPNIEVKAKIIQQIELLHPKKKRTQKIKFFYLICLMTLLSERYQIMK
ncbi:MAG: hypothetical protein ACXAC7_07840 [Candidatus Hodarchaeales archaeon]|jgi:hypothetical protein